MGGGGAQKMRAGASDGGFQQLVSSCAHAGALFRAELPGVAAAGLAGSCGTTYERSATMRTAQVTKAAVQCCQPGCWWWTWLAS